MTDDSKNVQMEEKCELLQNNKFLKDEIGYLNTARDVDEIIKKDLRSQIKTLKLRFLRFDLTYGYIFFLLD